MLDNGLKVILWEDHSSPLVIFEVWYRVGAMDEPGGKSGLSHLLEHMMFKGTEAYGPKVFSRTVSRNGGVDNAFTSRDTTSYFSILPSDRAHIAIEFEADRMRGLRLDEKEVLAERDVVMEERRMRYEDDPQNALFELVSAASYRIHPYRRPVIGWMEDLAAITRQDLAAHYKAYYSPDNAFIVAVGDFISGEMLGKIQDAFGKLEPSARPASQARSEPAQLGERKVVLKKEANVPYVLAAYHVPSLPHKDAYALDVLATVLSGGKSSRLYQSLVQKQRLAQSADAGYYALSRQPYLFFLDAAAAQGKNIKKVEEALFAEVARISKEPPGARELQKAKNSLEAGFIMGMDSIYLKAKTIGNYEILGGDSGGWRLLDAYIDGMRSVTAEDVSRVAGEYLTEDNRTIGILHPLPPKEPSQ
jgi:zinc protease